MMILDRSFSGMTEIFEGSNYKHSSDVDSDATLKAPSMLHF